MNSKLFKKAIIFSTVGLFVLNTSAYAATGIIKNNSVRIREQNNTSSNIVDNVSKNDEVEILGQSGDWYKISTNGKIGYVKTDFVTIKDNVAPGGIVSKVSVGLKLLPNMTSRELSKFEVGTSFVKVEEIANWYKLTNGNTTGWAPKACFTESEGIVIPEVIEEPKEEIKEEPKEEIKPEKVPDTKPVEKETKNETTTSRVGVVNVETAKIRETASATSAVTGFLDEGNKITIVAEDGDWYKFTYNNIEGYVNKKLITVKESSVSSRSMNDDRKEMEEKVETSASVLSTNGDKVVDFAMQYLGYSYVAGGKGPSTGFDCSGFTQYVYGNFGVTLGGTASSQNSVGVQVSRDNLQRGDLILFMDEGNTKIGHTGIYIGDGNFVHAANPKRGVVTDNLNTNSYYNSRFVEARRIVN